MANLPTFLKEDFGIDSHASKLIDIAVIGSRGCGKSAFVHDAARSFFPTEYSEAFLQPGEKSEYSIRPATTPPASGESPTLTVTFSFFFGSALYICQAAAASRPVAVGSPDRDRSGGAQVRPNPAQGPPQIRRRDPLLRLARPGLVRSAAEPHACVCFPLLYVTPAWVAPHATPSRGPAVVPMPDAHRPSSGLSPSRDTVHRRGLPRRPAAAGVPRGGRGRLLARGRRARVDDDDDRRGREEDPGRVQLGCQGRPPPPRAHTTATLESERAGQQPLDDLAR